MEALSASILNLVGRFTSRDEEIEKMSLTPEERAAVESDLCGTVDAMERLNLNDDASSLAELDAELSRIPDEGAKAAYLEAEQNSCPRLIDNDHKMAFLYAEQFDAKKAAERLVNYWSSRRAFFGPDKWLLPMTLRGALRDDTATLLQGIHRLLPVKDEFGRAIIYFVPSRHDPSKYSRDSVLRSYWYILQVACEDREVQKRGIIVISNTKHLDLSHASDPQLISGMFNLSQCLPTTWRSIHTCHPPLLHYFLYPVVSFLAGQHLRLRKLLHFGSQQHVLQELGQYGLPRDRIPTEMGGNLALDHSKWLLRRMATEDSSFDAPSVLNPFPLPSLSSDFNGFGIAPLESVLSTPHDSLPNRKVVSVSDDEIPSDTVAVANDTNSNTEIERMTPNRHVQSSGRQSDARMTRAVEAKLANPGMSLYHALVAGGFRFPDYGKPGVPDKICYDAEHVSVTQRKNNLSRRVRLAKKKGKVCPDEKIGGVSSIRWLTRGPKSQTEKVKNVQKFKRRDSFDDAIDQLPGLSNMLEDEVLGNGLLRRNESHSAEQELLVSEK